MSEKDKSGEFPAVEEHVLKPLSDDTLKDEVNELARAMKLAKNDLIAYRQRNSMINPEFRKVMDHICNELWLASSTWRIQGSAGNWYPVEGNIAEPDDILYVLKRIFRQVSKICADAAKTSDLNQLFDLVCDIRILVNRGEVDWSANRIYRGQLDRFEENDSIPKYGDEHMRSSAAFNLASSMDDDDYISPVLAVLKTAAIVSREHIDGKDLSLEDLKLAFSQFEELTRDELN